MVMPLGKPTDQDAVEALVQATDDENATVAY